MQSDRFFLWIDEVQQYRPAAIAPGGAEFVLTLADVLSKLGVRVAGAPSNDEIFWELRDLGKNRAQVGIFSPGDWPRLSENLRIFAEWDGQSLLELAGDHVQLKPGEVVCPDCGGIHPTLESC